MPTDPFIIYESPNQPTRKVRPQTACDRCHRLKVKCSPTESGACERCRKAGLISECTLLTGPPSLAQGSSSQPLSYEQGYFQLPMNPPPSNQAQPAPPSGHYGAQYSHPPPAQPPHGGYAQPSYQYPNHQQWAQGYPPNDPQAGATQPPPADDQRGYGQYGDPYAQGYPQGYAGNWEQTPHAQYYQHQHPGGQYPSGSDGRWQPHY